MKTRAAVYYQEKSQFAYEEVELEDPRDDEILVRVVGVGLCHTDVGFTTVPELYPFPAVLGHEGSGFVESVGANVTKVKPGDRVLMTFRSCGTCKRCESDDPSYCSGFMMLNNSGRRPDGSAAISSPQHAEISSNFFGQSSFAGHALCYERNVVKVEDEALPLEILGPIGCGIQTGVGAVLRSLETQKGQSILITGGGSVGLSAVMGAAIAGCSHIILSEPMAERRALAKELGATHVIDPAEHENVADAVRAILPDGVDRALDTSGAPPVQAVCVAALATKGIFGIVGVSPQGTQPPGDMNMIMTYGQSLRGIIEGDSDPDAFIPELISYFKEGRLPFDKLVKKYPLSEINTAIADQHAGSCVKAVLIPD